MSKDPSFLFYVNDFLSGTIFMSNEDIGIYVKLLCVQHQHGGIIKKNDFDAFVGDHGLVRDKFIETEDGFINAKMAKVMEERARKSENMSLNASKRWEEYKQLQSNCKAIAKQPKDVNVNKDVIKDKKEKKKKKFDFDPIWGKYPTSKKIGKKEAFGYFNTTVKTDKDYENIGRAVDNYCEYVKANNVEKKYIKVACNWFEDWESWADYKDEKAVSKFKPVDPDCKTCNGTGFVYSQAKSGNIPCVCRIKKEDQNGRIRTTKTN